MEVSIDFISAVSDLEAAVNQVKAARKYGKAAEVMAGVTKMLSGTEHEAAATSVLKRLEASATVSDEPAVVVRLMLSLPRLKLSPQARLRAHTALEAWEQAQTAQRSSPGKSRGSGGQSDNATLPFGVEVLVDGVVVAASGVRSGVCYWGNLKAAAVKAGYSSENWGNALAHLKASSEPYVLGNVTFRRIGLRVAS
jgi:hypothetical protein